VDLAIRVRASIVIQMLRYPNWQRAMFRPWKLRVQISFAAPKVRACSLVEKRCSCTAETTERYRPGPPCIIILEEQGDSHDTRKRRGTL
jgi:hypothetical protein